MSAPASVPTFVQVYWQDVTPDTAIPVLVLDVTYKMAILHVAGGWDYMPGHHDPEFARRQGAPTVFLNTLFHQSMIDRTVMDWAGPLAFLTRRKISMRDQICPGDRIEGHARIERVYRGDKGEGLVDFAVKIMKAGTVCCDGMTTLRLPERPA